MGGTSDNTPHRSAIGVGYGLGGLLLAVISAGCATDPGPVWPETPVPQRAVRNTLLDVYSPVPQTVTSQDWGKVLARYEGQVLLVCLWRASHPNVVACLHEAPEIQAQYRGSRVLGLNLDSPDEWLSTAVPVLRQAQVRFPVVTSSVADRDAMLGQLGVAGQPAAVTYVVLSPAGRILAVRKPFEPAPVVAAVAAPASNEFPRPTSQPAAARGVDAVRYNLRIVRLVDDVTVGRMTGIGWAKDLAGADNGQGAGGIASWLGMLGIEVASHVKGGERVAIAPIRGEADADLALRERFGLAVAAAVKACGRGVKDPAEVGGACRNLGMSADLLEAKPSSLRGSLDAEYILMGTIAAEEARDLR